MIRQCLSSETNTICDVINDGAAAYRGKLSADQMRDPYMPLSELTHEITDGVEFWGDERDGILAGVMGVQHVQDVTLIRHAYVRSAFQGKGVGTGLLSHLRNRTARPVLIGAWADAHWAIRFYRGHGFAQVDDATRTGLLRRYWKVPERQIETSVVLADPRWFELAAGAPAKVEQASVIRKSA